LAAKKLAARDCAPLPNLAICAHLGTQAKQHITCHWIPAWARMTQQWCIQSPHDGGTRSE
jgi:hypothetical protein